jgi:hypothetical protein
MTMGDNRAMGEFAEPKPAEPAPDHSETKAEAGAPSLGPGGILRLQSTIGNAAAVRLLARQPAAAAVAGDQAIIDTARRAFAAGGSKVWAAAIVDILRQILRSRFPAEAARVATITDDTNLRGVRPAPGPGNQMGLVGGDTVVRYVVNGFLEDLVRQVEAALLRDTLERTHGIAIVDASENWSLADVQDLRDALELLTARERAPLRGFRIIRESALADPSVDALTTVDGRGNKMIQLADMLFGRLAGKRTGMTLFKRPMGVHGIVHEFGHGIEFQNTAVLPRWRPVYVELRRAPTRVSDQPKGNPATQVDFELFAEAFARFHSDPAGLLAEARIAHAFFATRSHL